MRIIKSLMQRAKKNLEFDVEAYSYSSTINNNSIKKKMKNLKISDPEQSLKKILKWREIHEAPVDVVGCEKLADQQAPIQVQKFQTLVALMLSIQTKDEITGMIVNRLKQFGLTAENIMSTSEEQLLEMIKETNFNKRKAKNILTVSKLVAENGLASNHEDLLKYPGVGVKISMIYLRVAEGVDNGIGVDTHVHRICNRLGWVDTKTPDQTEIALQALFPKNLWKGINVGLVGFGQIHCEAKKPKCQTCPLRSECPSSPFF